MTQQSNNAQVVEMGMVKGDTHFYFDLVNCLIPSKQAPILMPALIPHLSLFVIESYTYLRNTKPEYARELKLQHETLLRYMRHKVKLLEEDDIGSILQAV